MMTIKNAGVRRVVRYAVPFLILPLLALSGAFLTEGRRYMLISLCAVFFVLLLFSSGYERSSVGTKRMVVAAVMTALCFAGRFIPLFKPVAALTIITAIYLGSETGFLVGSMTAFVSNFYFGQGPWTPFEMLGWGIIGFLAGVFAAPLRRSRVLLMIYGLLAGVLYSLIMDVWSVLWYSGTMEPKLYLASVVTAVPYTVVYAVSNAAYLFILAKPFGEKLRRLKIKGGL